MILYTALLISIVIFAMLLHDSGIGSSSETSEFGMLLSTCISCFGWETSTVVRIYAVIS